MRVSCTKQGTGVAEQAYREESHLERCDSAALALRSVAGEAGHQQVKVLQTPDVAGAGNQCVFRRLGTVINPSDCRFTPVARRRTLKEQCSQGVVLL